MDKNNTYAAERMQKILSMSKMADLDAAALLDVSNQTISEIRNGNGASFQVIMKFADAFSVSLDYLFGRVNETETEKFFKDRKLFLRASFRRASTIENWKALTDEKTGKRIPYDDFITRKRQMSALKSIMPYPENYIYELLSEAGYSPYDDDRRRQFYILPVDQDILDGFSEAMKSLSDREKEIVEKYYRDDMTLEGIAKEYGITKERIRQILLKASRKMRHPSNMRMILYGKRAAGVRNRRKILEVELEREQEVIKKIKDLASEISALTPEENQKKKRKSKMVSHKYSYYDNLEETKLTLRSYNCLKRMGFVTVGDVVDFYNREGVEGFMKIRNLGRKSLFEILSEFELNG